MALPPYTGTREGWARQLEGVVQTPAGGPLCYEMLSRGETS